MVAYPTLAGVLASLVAESMRLSPCRAILLHPSRVVQACDIKDCFALTAVDATFAGVFFTTLGEIARQGGLVVS